MRIGLFSAGWAVLAIAMVSPLHALADRLFSAHMIEHELMMIVAAPLLVASHPAAELLWALSPRARKRVISSARVRWLAATWTTISKPAVASLVHGIAIWAWHIPVLFESALGRPFLHYVQHASFLGTALLFWWAILPRPAGRRAFGVSMMHLFLTSLHTSLLGVILFLGARPWYASDVQEARRWGLSAIEDQQLAGLIMWIPPGVIYGGVALMLARQWIAAPSCGRLPPSLSTEHS